MPQDQISGAAANDWGHNMAERVAGYLGATLTNPGRSNEAEWNGKSIVIKSARLSNTLIGVTLPILSRIQSVVANIAEPTGKYSIVEVPSVWFSSEMRVPIKWPHIGFVQCSKIKRYGTLIGSIKI